MGRKVKYSKELKLEIVKRYLKGESPSVLANEYKLEQKTDNPIRYWARRYESLGDKAFDNFSKNFGGASDKKKICPHESGGSGFGEAKDERGLIKAKLCKKPA